MVPAEPRGFDASAQGDLGESVGAGAASGWGDHACVAVCMGAPSKPHASAVAVVWLRAGGTQMALTHSKQKAQLLNLVLIFGAALNPA
jgi:hypothetical protein